MMFKLLFFFFSFFFICILFLLKGGRLYSKGILGLFFAIIAFLAYL